MEKQATEKRYLQYKGLIPTKHILVLLIDEPRDKKWIKVEISHHGVLHKINKPLLQHSLLHW
jgi:hypothetical protein